MAKPTTTSNPGSPPSPFNHFNHFNHSRFNHSRFNDLTILTIHHLNDLTTMPLFRYQAIDNTGNSITGTMIAQDEPALESKLKDIGCWLVDASADRQAPMVDKAAKSQRGWLSWWGGVRRR